jgi:hypothetical protein
VVFTQKDKVREERKKTLFEGGGARMGILLLLLLLLLGARGEYTYLCVVLGRLEQLFEVLVAFLVLVSGLPPLGHSLAVEDEDVEERVQQEDGLGLD